jgi:dinuclear metal center YbgI/SA1388 family protein
LKLTVLKYQILSQTNLSLGMKIREIIHHLEMIAPPALQESYDNSGLITGDAFLDCTGVLVSLDATEEVVLEAVSRGCNLVISHHPIVFSGLKKLTGRNYVEKTVITAIRHNIALYAIHTNLDNVSIGVSGKMADLLQLGNRRILQPKPGLLKKLYTFVPHAQLQQVSTALFAAGAGHIGDYSECSYTVAGTGTYLPGEGTNPYAGKQGTRHEEPETRLEVIYPVWLESQVIVALKASHPYEEVAFDLVSLSNVHEAVGSGMIGELPAEVTESEFLGLLKTVFGLKVVRHTPFTGRMVRSVALCGGAGSFLVSRALQLNADVYITGDIKYHEFFDADGRMLLADIGHFESEQFTVDLLYDILAEKFPTFAVFKTGVNTNPVKYYI